MDINQAIQNIDELLFNLWYTDDRKENYRQDIFDAVESLRNTYSIILRDHESEELYIAEITTNWDIDRIIKESRKLTEETYKDDRDLNFIDELGERTWLNIYNANVLDI